MNRQQGKENRPPRKPPNFSPNGVGPPKCSQLTGWDSKAQVDHDYHRLFVCLDSKDSKHHSKLLRSLYGADPDKSDNIYRKLQPLVKQKCPNLLNALKRLYCFRKNQ